MVVCARFLSDTSSATIFVNSDQTPLKNRSRTSNQNRAKLMEIPKFAEMSYILRQCQPPKNSQMPARQFCLRLQAKDCREGW